ncbi:cardiolipin synthase [Microbaculum marinum]|uniref:Cardiolipin synthase n=1 Tax=Microbaculum marinum TaxID=1764581 RepID=A0AAW9RNS9_9HYPH
MTLTTILHVTLVLAITVRVIMKRPPTGVALSWLFLVMAVPFGGAAAYLLIGERRIGGKRARGLGHLRARYRHLSEEAVREGLAEVDWTDHLPAARGLDRLGRQVAGTGTVGGSDFTLLSDPGAILQAIARDVDNATTSVFMEFYIWNEGGYADEVHDALIRAAGRGVACRVLIDDLGWRPWWRSEQPRLLREAGVEVVPALPVGLFRTLFGRADLRLHRKIVVIDGEIGWTGSMNMVDPRFFKQDAGVGEWTDAMARIEGPAVPILAATVVGDWVLETGDSIRDIVESTGLKLTRPRGNTHIQVVASGPGETEDGLLLMLLALINAAREELILTTPYFVPDESLLRALRGAAGRGVDVTLILPEKIDSFLSRHASRTYYDELLDIGVKIQLFHEGLLHTKSITVDGCLSMFGTVNLDMRSLWLNYEVSMFVYCREFATALRDLQARYIAASNQLDPDAWRARPYYQRLIDNTVRLVSPLL